MISKPKIVWDEWNTKHIKKHKITRPEVEEAYRNEFGRSTSYLNRQAIYGGSKEGRLITIIVSLINKTKLYVITARDMSKKERRTLLL